MHSDIIMMDKNHLQFGGRGRAKTFPRPAPNRGAQLCSDLLLFPEQCSASQRIPLPALQLSSHTPQLTSFWPHQHCAICLRARSSSCCNSVLSFCTHSAERCCVSGGPCVRWWGEEGRLALIRYGLAEIRGTFGLAAWWKNKVIFVG